MNEAAWITKGMLLEEEGQGVSHPHCTEQPVKTRKEQNAQHMLCVLCFLNVHNFLVEIFYLVI